MQKKKSGAHTASAWRDRMAPTVMFLILFIVGLVLLGLGMLLKDKLPPRLAVTLVLLGTVMAMIFLNLSLFFSMMYGI